MQNLQVEGEKMLNKVILQGNIATDIEMRHTQSGISVATFRIAVARDFKNQSGERETDFINVVAWRNTADFVSRYFQKGQMAVVDGRLQVRTYTDKDGNRRYVTEVVAENIYFAGKRKEHQDTSEPQGFAEIGDEDAGDLPF